MNTALSASTTRVANSTCQPSQRRTSRHHGEPCNDVIADQALASYRWSLHQCEFATDIMFKRVDDLAALYPSLARYAIADLGSRDTMRFLGKRLVETFRGEVITNYKHRPEGICVRHPDDRRKAAAKLSRHLRILCAHNAIRRVEGTHRYVVTANGRVLIAAVVAALDASVSKLRQCA